MYRNYIAAGGPDVWGEYESNGVITNEKNLRVSAL
jgi:hypothetical protein